MVDPLGAHLVRKGLLTQAQLDEALKSQLIYGGSLGTNLVELGMLELATLGQALSDTYHFPLVTEAELAAVTSQTVALLRPELARHHLAFPLVVEGRRLRVAMAEPQDPRHVDALAFATGMRIVPSILPEPRLLQVLERHYGIVRPARPIRPGQLRTRAGQGAAPEPQARPPVVFLSLPTSGPSTTPVPLSAPTPSPGASPLPGPSRAPATASGSAGPVPVALLHPPGLTQRSPAGAGAPRLHVVPPATGAASAPSQMLAPPVDPPRASPPFQAAAVGAPAAAAPPVAVRASGAAVLLAPAPCPSPPRAAPTPPPAPRAVWTGPLTEPAPEPLAAIRPRTAELFPEVSAPLPSVSEQEQVGPSSHEACASEQDVRPVSLPLVELSAEEVLEASSVAEWRCHAMELPQGPVGAWEMASDIDYIESDSGSASWAQRGLEVDFSSLAANDAEGVPLARVHEFLPRWEARLGRDEGNTGTQGPSRVRLSEAMEALRRATTRGQLGQALLSYSHGRFPRSFLLGETFGAIRVGLACGTGSDKPEVAALKVDLSTPSLLARAAADGGPVVSSAPESRTDEALFTALGGASSHLVAAPIRLRQRAVGFVVIDGGPSSIGAEELDELERLLAAASEAYGRLHETSF
ncbi:hypothetical protein D187_005621 [Cystobacter fuscus DSM 2262]|uniref:Type II secretion system protein GspE N-terminal domain-containing protein n=1 Tax=Cystobacter fuscus (strain ATCC 25194 / DSM 2262 / NBRC 100088 / M29) TaxID=1242864 RepID=S9PJI8_CYSF2|nr:hypothetical protein [Cystobacter fuscus]EPX63216.1 hypothetical protein D187_005621 [Cystobacter fuscus DSM 2262]